MTKSSQDEKKGLLDKKASNDSVENIAFNPNGDKPNKVNLVGQINELWSLEKRNREHEKYMTQRD